ncbi:hypothetical protein CFP65_4709 [Kitasatospora sp. MMS16-BH015]|uniref:hypothetical protein n=1 Tax=Kitasatospora sp. MMS16-BH015 TaxID=2018025 RepID=UPI000CA1CA44|nr:hypothetical protein [Kitasatospora sp. MMS16-BH015]AUG79435.1 hypothetical protein CFP65_4709 [Kitasatospora sp. MMS16-BH015]
MAGKAVHDAQFWASVAGLTAALAVVAAYLAGGPRMVWVVAAVEVLLVMAHVAHRFKGRARPGTVGRDREAAHCERCRRTKEQLRSVPGH